MLALRIMDHWNGFWMGCSEKISLRSCHWREVLKAEKDSDIFRSAWGIFQAEECFRRMLQVSYAMWGWQGARPTLEIKSPVRLQHSKREGEWTKVTLVRSSGVRLWETMTLKANVLKSIEDALESRRYLKAVRSEMTWHDLTLTSR